MILPDVLSARFQYENMSTENRIFFIETTKVTIDSVLSGHNGILIEAIFSRIPYERKLTKTYRKVEDTVA